MKIFLGSRNLKNKNFKLEYFVLCNKHNYGVQVYKKDKHLSSASVINISQSEDDAIFIAAKLLKDCISPENLKQNVQSMKTLIKA